MNWTLLTAVANLVSTVAVVLTALYLRAELKAQEKDRYLAVTNELFALWQSREFMEAHLWLLHSMEDDTWEGFIRNHRGDYGENAFHRVGSFYDRVGTLVRMGVVNEKEILSTIGAYAIAAWQKMGPLVREARRIENSVLFDDFERLLPACYECYVPTMGMRADVTPFALEQKPGRKPEPTPPQNRKTDLIRPGDLKRRLDRGEPLTVLDVRRSDQVEQEPRSLPGAVLMPLGEYPFSRRFGWVADRFGVSWQLTLAG
jgi:hypothetical protein